MRDCYYDQDGCLVCPERPAVTGQPAYIKRTIRLGWDAGADSHTRLDGDFDLVWDMSPAVVGAIVGIKTHASHHYAPAAIEHGWYFCTLHGVLVAQVIERGSVQFAAVTPAAGVMFGVRRVLGVVQYLLDDATHAVSGAASYGPKIASTCLYASGDAVPSVDAHL